MANYMSNSRQRQPGVASL